MIPEGGRNKKSEQIMEKSAAGAAGGILFLQPAPSVCATRQHSQACQDEFARDQEQPSTGLRRESVWPPSLRANRVHGRLRASSSSSSSSALSSLSLPPVRAWDRRGTEQANLARGRQRCGRGRGGCGGERASERELQIRSIPDGAAATRRERSRGSRSRCSNAGGAGVARSPAGGSVGVTSRAQ